MARRGINQQTLAGKCGLAVSSLSEIRRGHVSPGIDTLNDIAHALGVQAWELLANDEETRRRAIERALSRVPVPDDVVEQHYPLPPKVEALRPRKEVAARRRKKDQGKGARP